MGCDIHLFAEYKQSKRDSWSTFGGAQLRMQRHYGVFSVMAGVRTWNNYDVSVQPKGLPSDMGWKAERDYNLFIVDDERDESGYCTKEQAERWVKSGSSEYTKEDKFVTDPDAHSGSWLSPDEFEAALAKGINGEDFINIEDYKALLSLLRSFEQQGYESRIVFWFDN